jgi:heptosyltransferase-2
VTTAIRPDRILIRAPNPLGDVVMAEPAIRAIARHHPGARLELQIPRALAPLGHAWPFVDAVLPVVSGGRMVERLHAAWAPIRLRRRRFALCVLFPNGRAVAALAARAGIPRRVGYARDGRETLLTDALPVPAEPRRLHMVLYYWGLARAVGCADVRVPDDRGRAVPTEASRILAQDDRTTPRIAPTDAMGDAARRVLGRAGLASEPYIAMAPGAAYGSAKCWPARHFGALARRLARDLGQPCLVLGAAGERRLGAAVREHAGAGGSLVDLTGRTDVGALIGILAGASLFVGNDSGPAHLAAALGRPGVTLFGSTSASHSGPVGPRMRTLHRPLPCAPCFAQECPLGHLACLEGLSVDAVADAAHQSLRDGAA